MFVLISIVHQAFNAHHNGVLCLSWCPSTPITTALSTGGQSTSTPTLQTVARKRLVTGGADNQVSPKTL